MKQTQTELEARQNNLQADRAREDEASAKLTTELQQRVAELENQSEQFLQEREQLEQDHQELQQQLSELQQQHTALQLAATTADETLASRNTATANEPQTPMEKRITSPSRAKPRRAARNRAERTRTNGLLKPRTIAAARIVFNG